MKITEKMYYRGISLRRLKPVVSILVWMMLTLALFAYNTPGRNYSQGTFHGRDGNEQPIRGDDRFVRKTDQDTVRGMELPELVHNRSITQHPKWLMEEALRPAFVHTEWGNTPVRTWAKIVREAGANCLVGVGEMPAGTLNGKLNAINFRAIDQEDFTYPPGYKKNDYSWLKEFTDAGHAEGLKVVIYDGAWRTLDPILVEHPEWRQCGSAGNTYVHGFGSWHSPYREAYIERWVKVAKEYGIDGIMVDMHFTSPENGDYNPYTVNAFKEMFGVEPPRKRDLRDLTWQRWMDFQTWTREEVMLDVTEALHKVNPEIACIWNQTCGWIFTLGHHNLSTRAGLCADGLLEEMGWEFQLPGFSLRPHAWSLQSAWQSLFLHCRTPYGLMWHRNGFYTRVSHEALSYSMFANGVAPAIVVGGNLDYMKQIWEHIRPCEAYMSGATLVPYAAIHFSENTLNWYANARGDDAAKAYMKGIFGLLQALLETHLPVAIITDDDLNDLNSLKPYTSLVLPNTACLSDKQAAMLTGYVQDGGGLVASFETGLFDENGTKREKPVLENLFGVNQGSVQNNISWILDLDPSNLTHEIVHIPEIINGGDPSQGVLNRQPYVTLYTENYNRDASILKTTALSGVQSVRLRKYRNYEEGYNLLHARTTGRGRVAYFPPDISHGYFLYNHPVCRLIIERTVQWSAGKPPFIETNAPMALQTVCFRKGNDLLVNLVNDNSSFGRAAPPNPENFGGFRDEVLPVFGVKVAVRGDYRKAFQLPEGKKLTVHKADELVEVTVPRVDIHTMIVFSP